MKVRNFEAAKNNRLHIKGDMKRDQILTIFWGGLVAVPAEDAGMAASRLTDECMTQVMLKKNKAAPEAIKRIIELIKVTS